MVEDHLAERGMLSVCIREVQKTLADSSKRLLESKLSDFSLGAADGFKVFRDTIETPGDGAIIFQGMQDHTAESIKSLEGFKRAWWEEAQTASHRSLSLLRPTIRAQGSELWFSWNARLDTDPVDVMLRGAEKPTGAVVIEANWRDNPWFNGELEQERQDTKRMQPDQYGHIWEGEYITFAEGAYFATDLGDAKAHGRIGKVGKDPLMAIRTFWDIGGTGAKADATSIVIAQFVGREIRVLDHYSAQGQPLATHVDWLRAKGYGSALVRLPHDGVAGDKVYATSFEGALREAGFQVQVTPNQGKGAAKQRIEAVRRLFPNIWFNEDTTGALRKSLGWYHEKRDENRAIGLGPEHDWSSHDADAFGLMCVTYEAPQQSTPRERYRSSTSGRSSSWMAD